MTNFNGGVLSTNFPPVNFEDPTETEVKRVKVEGVLDVSNEPHVTIWDILVKQMVVGIQQGNILVFQSALAKIPFFMIKSNDKTIMSKTILINDEGFLDLIDTILTNDAFAIYKPILQAAFADLNGLQIQADLPITRIASLLAACPTLKRLRLQGLTDWGQFRLSDSLTSHTLKHLEVDCPQANPIELIYSLSLSPIHILERFKIAIHHDCTANTNNLQFLNPNAPPCIRAFELEITGAGNTIFDMEFLFAFPFVSRLTIDSCYLINVPSEARYTHFVLKDVTTDNPVSLQSLGRYLPDCNFLVQDDTYSVLFSQNLKGSEMFSERSNDVNLFNHPSYKHDRSE